MKLIIKKLWMVVLSLCMPTMVSAYDFEIDGIAYNITSFTDLTCVVVHKSTYEGNITIPEEVSYKGKTLRVTELDEQCFYGCKNLTSITLPNSIKTLGEYCFYNCSNLQKVSLPQELYEIADGQGYSNTGCFNGCISLIEITLPATLKKLGGSTFMNCTSLASISLPSSLEYIGIGCFSGCSSLKTCPYIPMQKWPDYLFEDCRSIESVDIPEGVVSLGKDCFSGCI